MEPNTPSPTLTDSLSEQLIYTTARLECFNEGESGREIGTSFLFNFQSDNNSCPAIITNKHVVRSYNTIKFRLNIQSMPQELENRVPRTMTMLAQQDYVVRHPDDNVDLCLVLIGNILKSLEAANIVPRIRMLGSQQLPTEQQWNQFSAIEEVTIIGYPNDIWDAANNLPIVRRGITATHPKNDYKSRKEFLIDSIMIPGSSGSPVYLYNEGSYSVPTGIAIGTRLLLLGVATKYWYLRANGNSSIEDIPSGNDNSTEIRIPINLGPVIKSSRVLELGPAVRVKAVELNARAQQQPSS